MNDRGDSISIFNLNCWLFPPPLSTDREVRTAKIVTLIKDRDPDIVTLQEVWSNKCLRGIEQELRDYYAISSKTRFYNRSGLVTLVKQRPLSSHVGSFKLSLRHNVTEWFLRKGYMVVRLKLGAHFVDIINTHLYSPFSALDRGIPKKQFEEVARHASRNNTVICGDLNMREDSLEEANQGRFLRLCNSETTYDARNPYRHKRFNSFTSNEDKKIDYILFKGELRARSKCDVIKAPFVSDHYPMFCQVSLMP